MVFYVYVEVDMRGVLLALVVASRRGRATKPQATPSSLRASKLAMTAAVSDWAKKEAAELDALNRLVLVLGYDCDDLEREAAELVPAIEGILAAEGISLPTEDPVSFFPISENRGYGNPFNGRQISHVLG